MSPLRLNVLFICTGNTCRSPMAEHLFRRMLATAGLSGIAVRSAGIAPSPGMAIAPLSIAALAREGVENVPHTARRLDDETLKWADLILTMEEAHRDFIAAHHPSAAEKTQVLKIFAETADGRSGIADPYGGDDADYRAALADIKSALTAIIQKWRRESGA